MGEIAGTCDAAGLIEWGAAADGRSRGRSSRGDRFVVAPFPNGVLAAVVDGLGHGERGRRAAEIAVTRRSKRTRPNPVLSLASAVTPR